MPKNKLLNKSTNANRLQKTTIDLESCTPHGSAPFSKPPNRQILSKHNIKTKLIKSIGPILDTPQEP